MTPILAKNYHTHTYRCKHAAGDVPAYVDEALKAGITTLGMSDHTPLPDDWMGSVRMSLAELDGYISAIENAGRPGIRLVKGMECDINPLYYGFYREELRDKRGCEYLIGALHWYRHDGEWLYAGRMPTAAHLRSYTDALIAGIESGLFAFIAHPDHFAAGYLRWDSEAEACSRSIIAAARDRGVLLEINGNGFRKPPVEENGRARPPYPHRRFWEIAAGYGSPAICNSDAHRPGDVAASLDLCLALAEETGLKVGDLRPGRD